MVWIKYFLYFSRVAKSAFLRGDAKKFYEKSFALAPEDCENMFFLLDSFSIRRRDIFIYWVLFLCHLNKEREKLLFELLVFFCWLLLLTFP